MLEGKGTKNLGATFRKIIRRAGVDVWPKPFQNLRSSLQTKLEQRLPTYVVCKWLGNTPGVANKHYLTVTEDHFQMATGGVGQSEDENWGLTGDKLGMQPPAGGCTTAQKKSRTTKMARENTSFSEVVSVLENTQVAGTGLEQIDDLSGTSNICAEGSAKSSALSTEMHHLDPQLQLLIDAWPTLSKAVQQQIMLLVG